MAEPIVGMQVTLAQRIGEVFPTLTSAQIAPSPKLGCA
jgi:hypothetical protein